MKILLVDDEKELVETLAERLSYRGIEADWATNGEDALKRLENKTYALAVLDVKITKISGLELKKIMCKKYPDMKFIFMTGHGSEDDFKAGAAETGSAYYLPKPIRIELLIEKIKEVLKK